ncbi:DUF2780 domain-containing protein [Shewanella salipaludis]|uniref:DUF2780 domain-containing protein n=1 Tax=Shewanella salipaludis TaxID=2723052 RepID=A0A972JJF6_9GAMM|nr:DUF2780 domain-containing protein [Shewanella salipaludis]NMH65060.1 DUF2780 domain-containing protein [Shewanella salipaludis]
MKHTAAISLLIGATLTVPASAGWLDKLTAAPETATQATEPQSNELVGSVMSQLGLSQSQSEGGLGSLLSLAQSSLGAEDFGQLSASIPDAEGLLAAAPATDSDAGMSGLLSKAGSLGSAFQGSAMVYDAFEKLGISKELVAPMTEILKSYLQTNGAEGSADLLLQGLSSLL